MELDFFSTGHRYFNATVWHNGNDLMLDRAFTTKSEAIRAVKNFLKKCTVEKSTLDCFVREYDENECAVKTWTLTA